MKSPNLIASLFLITLTMFFIGRAAQAKTNIIVIISDDAGYADFGFMDGLSGTNSIIPTPHLDALAARGVTFSRAYVAANCQPTRAAIVTGAYQQRIGNESVGNNLFLISQQDASSPDNNLEGIYEGLPVEVDTIWDRFKTLGYNTTAIGKWHLGSTQSTTNRVGNRPQHQGIDTFFGMWHGSRNFLAGSYNENGVSDPTHALQPRYFRECFANTPHPTNPSDPDGYDVVIEYSHYADVPTAPQYMTTIFSDYAEQYIEDHHDDTEPFLMYLAHPAPHKPWTNESPDYNHASISNWPDTVTNGLNPGDAGYKEGPNYRKQVASMMITMDKEIGDLMAKLDDPNGDGNNSDSITDDTMVIFLNDNGGVSGKAANGINGTSNGILNGFKGSSKDGGIRVPMILAGAGVDVSKQGTVYTNPVHGIDILPTAFELAGGGVLSPEDDQVDGVNILPFINGSETGRPHDVIVHKWRGSFAVIKGDWKLQNSRNINAEPQFYDLWNLVDHPDEISSDSEIDNPTYAPFIEELKRDLTDAESTFDKPRYAILANTLETEPRNVFNHHIYNPGIDNDWSGGVDLGNNSADENNDWLGIRNWLKVGTTNQVFLFNTDSFPGATLEFPVHSANYTANNDYRRKTGMEYMLNQIVLSGDFTGAAQRTATLQGLPLIFTDSLTGIPPQVELTASNTGSAAFAFNIDMDLILYDDLILTGDGDATLNINGVLSDYFTPRGITKRGSSTTSLSGMNSYSGDTRVEEGTLTLAEVNSNISGSAVHLSSNGTLNLTFSETNTVAKIFIDGVQYPAGIYKASGALGAGFGLPHLGGSGKLLVTGNPSGYASWAEGNAPGQDPEQDHDNDKVPNGLEYFMGETGNSVTAIPGVDTNRTITWPMASFYSGTYGVDFAVETTTNLMTDSWTPVNLADSNLSVNIGNSVAYSLKLFLSREYVRLMVDPL